MRSSYLPIHYGVENGTLTVYEAGRPVHVIPLDEAKRLAANLAQVAFRLRVRGADGHLIEFSDRMRLMIARDLLKVALEVES